MLLNPSWKLPLFEALIAFIMPIVGIIIKEQNKITDKHKINSETLCFFIAYFRNTKIPFKLPVTDNKKKHVAYRKSIDPATKNWADAVPELIKIEKDEDTVDISGRTPRPKSKGPIKLPPPIPRSPTTTPAKTANKVTLKHLL